MKKRLFALALAFIIVSGLLIGCGKNTSPTSQPSTTQQGNAPQAPQQGNTDSSAPNVFTFAIPQDMVSFDPGAPTSVFSPTINSLIYDQLIRRDSDGAYLPGLLTEWSSANNAQDWTVKLREGLKFHNGTPMTTRDLKATFERYSIDETLNTYFNWQNLTEVEIINDLECVFHFSEPFGSFVSAISKCQYFSADAYEKSGDQLFVENIWGCGPFQWVSWEPGDRIILERSDNWWDAAAGVSNVDRIEIKIIPEDTSRISALRTGEMDLVAIVPTEQIAILEGISGLVVDSRPSTLGVWFGLQCEKGRAFEDKNVRLAFTHSLDRQLIVDSLLGMGTAAYWPVIEGIEGFDPNHVNTYAAYDLELAKRYLQESSYNGETIRFMVQNGMMPQINEVVLAIVAMMTEAGFNVETQMLDNAAFNTNRAGGDYDLSISNTRFGNIDPGFWTYRQYSFQVGHYMYDDPEMIEKARLAYFDPDWEQQIKYIREVFHMSMEAAAPVVPFLFQHQTTAYYDYVGNLTIYADGQYDLSRVTVNR